MKNCPDCQAREKKLVLLYRVHQFCIKMSNNRFTIVKAIAATAIQMMMGLIFVSTIQEGETLWQQKNASTATQRSVTQKPSAPPAESKSQN